MSDQLARRISENQTFHKVKKLLPTIQRAWDNGLTNDQIVTAIRRSIREHEDLEAEKSHGPL